MSQAVAGHARKKMVFDLIIQTTEQVINNDGTFYVASSQNLLSDEILIFIFIEDRHSNMVRHEYEGKVKAEHTLMHNCKEDRLPESHANIKQGEINWEICRQR